MATNKLVTLEDLRQFAENCKNKFIGATQLTAKQDKTDNTLQTTAKTVVGAINENKERLDNIAPATTPTVVLQNLENGFVLTSVRWAEKISKRIYAIEFELSRSVATTAFTENRVINNANDFTIDGKTVNSCALSCINIFNSSPCGCTYNGARLYINGTTDSTAATNPIFRVSGVVYVND